MTTGCLAKSGFFPVIGFDHRNAQKVENAQNVPMSKMLLTSTEPLREPQKIGFDRTIY